MLNGMTHHRTRAYRRVVTTLGDMGPAKLWPHEQTIIREAADALVFADDVANEETRTALGAAVALTDRLVDAGRWTTPRAHELLDDIWACGPGRAFGLPIAA
jgi:hypothetical protein